MFPALPNSLEISEVIPANMCSITLPIFHQFLIEALALCHVPLCILIATFRKPVNLYMWNASFFMHSLVSYNSFLHVS